MSPDPESRDYDPRLFYPMPMEKQASAEVLRVTNDGKFIWHDDADHLIEHGDYAASPATPHILRALRERERLHAVNAMLLEALEFMCRRCEEQGFYTPHRQPLVSEALAAARRNI